MHTYVRRGACVEIRRQHAEVGYFFPLWVSGMFIHKTISPSCHEPHMIVCCALRGSLSSVDSKSTPYTPSADPSVSSAAAQYPWSLSAEDLPGSVSETILFSRLSCVLLLIWRHPACQKPLISSPGLTLRASLPFLLPHSRDSPSLSKP